MQIGLAYKEIDYKQLLPLLNNQVKLCDGRLSCVHDIALSFLLSLHHACIPVMGSYLVGSSLTHLFAASTEHHDIDMKIMIRGTHQVAQGLFSHIGNLPLFQGVPYSLDHLAHETFKPVYIDRLYSFKGYTFQGLGGDLPFEISLIVADCLNMLPPTVMNLDSFYIPVTFFPSPFGFILGSFVPEHFRLYSTQGTCQSVIEQIKERRLTCQDPKSVKKFGWTRYLSAIVEGFSCQDQEMNDIFFENETENVETFIYDMHQFVQRKKQGAAEVYWLFLICNAIFQCPKTSFLERLIGQLTSLLEHQTPSAAWMLPLKAVLRGPFPLKDIPTVLQLFLPLLSQSVTLKNHLNGTWLQCKLKGGTNNLHILIPYAFCDRQKALPSILNALRNEGTSIVLEGARGDLPFEESCFTLLSDISTIEESPLVEDLIFGWISLSPPLFSLLFSKMSNSRLFLGARYLPFKLRLICQEIQKTDINSSILQKIVFNLDFSSLDEEQKHLLCQLFLEKSGGFKALLEKPSEYFFDQDSCFDRVLMILNFYDEKKRSAQACLLIDHVLNNDGTSLSTHSCSFLEKLFQMTTQSDQEQMHSFSRLLRADRSRALDYLQMRLQAALDKHLLVWQIYGNLYDEKIVADFLEEKYLVLDSYRLYLHDTKDETLKENGKRAASFRMQNTLCTSLFLLSSFHLFEKQDQAQITDEALKAISQKRLNFSGFSLRSLYSLLEGYCEMQGDCLVEPHVLLGLQLSLKALSVKSKKMNLPPDLETVLMRFSKKISRFDKETVNHTPLILEISAMLIKQFLKKSVYVESANEILTTIYHPRLNNQNRENCAIDVEVYCSFLENEWQDSTDLSMIYQDVVTLFYSIPHQKNATELTVRFSKMLLVLCEKRMVIAYAIPLIKIGLELFNRSSALPVTAAIEDPAALTKFLSFVLFHTQEDGLYYYCILPDFYTLFLRIPSLVSSRLLKAFIAKGLAAAKRITKDDRWLEGAAALLSFSYKVCPKYTKTFSHEGTNKGQVMEALDCLFSFPDQEKVMEKVERLLKYLAIHNFLEGQFIGDMVPKIAEVNRISLPDAYTQVLMNPFFCSCVPWNVLIEIINPVDIRSWKKDEINLFMMVLASVWDTQFLLHMNTPPGKKESLDRILSFYLNLVEHCSVCYLSANLLGDLIANPGRYCPRGTNEKNHLLEVFAQIANKIHAVGYSFDDIKEKKVSKFLRDFHSFWNTLPQNAKEMHARTLSHLTPRPPQQLKSSTG
ncbi:MAG: hypothetical protein ACH350_05090 [Parachlamydiaceae bacterium]